MTCVQGRQHHACRRPASAAQWRQWEQTHGSRLQTRHHSFQPTSKRRAPKTEAESPPLHEKHLEGRLQPSRGWERLPGQGIPLPPLVWHPSCDGRTFFVQLLLSTRPSVLYSSPHVSAVAEFEQTTRSRTHRPGSWKPVSLAWSPVAPRPTRMPHRVMRPLPGDTAGGSDPHPHIPTLALKPPQFPGPNPIPPMPTGPLQPKRKHSLRNTPIRKAWVPSSLGTSCSEALPGGVITARSPQGLCPLAHKPAAGPSRILGQGQRLND